MGSVADKVRELIAEADDLPHGPSRMALVEEAARLADAHGEVDLGYEARMAILEGAVFGGYPEKALVAFGWLKATCDESPEQFPESQVLGRFLLLRVDLLWAYKWVVQNTPGFPQISKRQILDTLDEMEERFSRNHYSLRPVWMNRAWVGMELGESPDEIARYYEEWTRADRDAYADCEACEQNFEVEVRRFLGDWEGSLQAAGPLLTGELSCAEVPHLTISNLVMEHWVRGELEDAERMHQRGYDMCRSNRDFLAELAEHVDYRIATGDLDGAVAIAERHLGWVSESRSGRRRWRWFVTLSELFARLAEDHDTVAFRLPADLAPADGADEPARLGSWFADKADELSAKFDERNENDFVSRRGAELLARLGPRNS